MTSVLLAGWLLLGVWSAIRFRPLPRRVAVQTSARGVFRFARHRALGDRRKRRRSDRKLRSDLPDAVDLLVLAVSAGLTVPLAVEEVGRRSQGSVAAALQWAQRRSERGEPLADALEAAVPRFGEPLRPLVRPLVATQRYGVPLIPALESLAAATRVERRQAAERTARKLPVRLLFPLVLCILPSFALLTVVPVIVSSLGAIEF